jgi:hypothetical protein
MRVAGAAQDSGGGSSVYLEGDPKAMGASGVSAPDSGASKNREVVETAWRMPGTEYRLRSSGDASKVRETP